MGDDTTKTFNFKGIETQMLNVILQQQQVMLTNFLSFIAMERFAYQVTPATRFELATDLKSVKVSEIEEKPAETPDKPASDTAQALGAKQ